jgi:hypothetical protein
MSTLELNGLACGLSGHLAGDEPAQLLINHRQQLLGRLGRDELQAIREATIVDHA